MGRFPLRTCLLIAAASIGCTKYRDDLRYDHPVEYQWSETDGSGEYALFAGVDWNKRTFLALRPYLVDQQLVSNRQTLILFAGPGVLPVECAFEGAKSVLAVAESPVALDCIRYNVAANQQDANVTSVLATEQGLPPAHAKDRFEVVIARLRDGAQARQNEIKLLLDCASNHLEPGGKMLVACDSDGVATQFETACKEAAEMAVSRDEKPGAMVVLLIDKKTPIVAGQTHMADDPQATESEE